MTTKTASSSRPRTARARVSPPDASEMHPITDGKRLNAVMDAVNDFDARGSEAWKTLKRLSPNPIIKGADAVPEGIFEIGQDKFTAAATLHVALSAGRDSANGFPSLVTGHFDNDGTAIIEEMTTDISSFYE